MTVRYHHNRRNKKRYRPNKTTPNLVLPPPLPLLFKQPSSLQIITSPSSSVLPLVPEPLVYEPLNIQWPQTFQLLHKYYPHSCIPRDRKILQLLKSNKKRSLLLDRHRQCRFCVNPPPPPLPME